MKTRSSGQPEIPLHLELGRTERQAKPARRRRVSQEEEAMEQGRNQEQGGNQNERANGRHNQGENQDRGRRDRDGNQNQNREEPPRQRVFGDCYRPRYEHQGVQELGAEAYQIPPAIVNLIQNSSSFQGLGTEDPQEHLASFLEHCSLMKQGGIEQDSLRRMLFPFSLKGRAKEWYRSQAMHLQSFDELVERFMTKFFSPERMDKLRQDVHQFRQVDGESFPEAWERFQDLVQKCPNLMVDDGYEVQIFYNGLTPETKMNVNASAGGSLQDMTYEAVRDLFQKITTNGCRSTRLRRTAGVLEVSPTLELEAQVAALSKRMEMVDARGMGQSANPTCGVCQGPHFNDQCPLIQESCNFVNNAPRGNNQGWGNQANQGNQGTQWRNQGVSNASWAQGQGGSSNQEWRNQGGANHQWGNQGAQNSNWGHNNQVVAPRHEVPDPVMKMLQEMKDDTRAMGQRFASILDEHGKTVAEQGRTIKDIQKNLSYVTQHINQRPQGGLPSDTVPNPKGKEQCMHVTLRSGKILEGPSVYEEGESSQGKHHDNEEENLHEPEEEQGAAKRHDKCIDEPKEVEEEADSEEGEDERNEENERLEEPETVEKKRRTEEELVPEVTTRLEEEEEDNNEASGSSKKRGNMSPKHEKGPEKKKKKEKGRVPSEEELNEKLDKQLRAKWNYPDQRPPPPYPMPPSDSQQYKGFMQLLKDIVLNISMHDLLCGVPKYGKYIRDMLSGKGKGKLDGIVTVSKACSCYIKRDLTLLEKKSDPGVPTIPITIEERRFPKALCDLGSGVSLMPLSLAQALGLDRELKYTPVMLQLADKSLVKPDGIVEDVLVQVDRFLVPTDFIILDMEADKEVPLILGRPFLATGDAMIGAKDNDVHFNVGEEPVHIESSRSRKQAKQEEGCFFLKVTKSASTSDTPQDTDTSRPAEEESISLEADPYEGLTWDNMEPGFLFAEPTPRCYELKTPKREPEDGGEDETTVVQVPSLRVSAVKLKSPKAEKEELPSSDPKIVESPTNVKETEAKSAKKNKKKGSRTMWIPVGALGIMKMGRAGPTIAKENVKQTLSPKKEKMKVTSPRRGT